MHLIIEYSGTPEHLKGAEAIVDFADEYIGCNIDTVVGSETGSVMVYNEELTKVAEFDRIPDYTELHFNLQELIE